VKVELNLNLKHSAWDGEFRGTIICIRYDLLIERFDAYFETQTPKL
jgi:hypothetical protein